MENPCLKTGITVAADGGKIHGDLFFRAGELQVRGSHGIIKDFPFDAEMEVEVIQQSERNGWVDFVVRPISMTPKLEEYLAEWTEQSLEFIKNQIAGR